MYDNFETLNSAERDNSSGEDQEESLLAVGITNPNTSEKFWHLRNANGELVPLDTREDENGDTREVLPDNTLGRKVEQDPIDDPDRTKNLYGAVNAENDNPQNTITEALPSDQKNSSRPISLSTEAVPGDALGTNQANANALASETNAINNEISDASPITDPTSENPSEFSENASNYREKISENLDNIMSLFMQKADTLRGLGMPDAARLFAEKAQLAYFDIKTQIDVSGEDYTKLVDVYAKYFDGNASDTLSKIGPTLDADPSTIKFDQLLAQTTTIPELTYVADRLVAARHEQKTQKLAELKEADTKEAAAKITEELKATENVPEESENLAA